MLGRGSSPLLQAEVIQAYFNDKRSVRRGLTGWKAGKNPLASILIRWMIGCILTAISNHTG